ncbi:protoporphyrinogen oxidase [Alcaligenaceae bacterium CGII-47]|nr:protoporphyrinogen oxidase [Alcaligenaceae bacterium CGII-47]
MKSEARRVAIIGGGITGLSTAFHLHQQKNKGQLPLEFSLLESEPRLGGKIKTLRHGAFLIEAGPDSFHIKGKSLLDLIQAAGLGHTLIRSNTGQAFVFAKDALYPIPAGMVMGVPTKLMPFLKSGLFSPAGKLRAALELLYKHNVAVDDESVDSFFRRHFGSELVDRLIEPLFSAIYAESTERLSAHATMPHMVALQKSHQSLILGMRRSQAGPEQNKRAPRRDKTPGPFTSLDRGLESLVAAIEDLLPPSSVMRNTTVTRIQEIAGRYRLTLRGNDTLDVDAVVLTAPGESAASLLGMPASFSPLQESPPASVANVVLAFRQDAIKIHNPGTGFIVPRNAGCAITACTWSHLKWPHTTPKGYALLRCYVGRPGDDAIVNADDHLIVQTVLHDLKRVMAINDAPEFHVVTRWRNAMPRYAVGHLVHMAKLTESVATRFPGVVLAGASYGGIGLSECVRQGEDAAHATLAHIFARPSLLKKSRQC